MRGVLGGLLGFTLAVIVIAALLGRVLPNDWATSAFVAFGIAAAAVAGAAGGFTGAWLGPPGGAILGSALGAAILFALQPQADIATLLSVLAVLAGAAAAALGADVLFSSRSRGLHRHG
jgi:hypothetical protein